MFVYFGEKAQAGEEQRERERERERESEMGSVLTVAGSNSQTKSS